MDRDEMVADSLSALKGIAKKLKDSMDTGPEGDDCLLSSNESCLLYRFLTEGAGCRF